MPGSHVRAVFGEPKKIFVRIIMNIFEHVDIVVPKKQGDLGVARAVYEFTRLGYVVLAPLSDSSKYDLVVDDGERLYRVQVKTTRQMLSHGGFAVNLKTCGGNTKQNTTRNRHPDDYDVLFVLTQDNRCWIIPAFELGNVGSCITVGGQKYNNFEIK